MEGLGSAESAGTVKFGHSCDPRKDILEEIETIAGMGFDFAEITMEAPKGDPTLLWKRKNRIKNALKKHNVFATAHAPLAIDLGHFFGPVRGLWVGHAKRMLEICEKIGVKKINFHANYSSLIIESIALKKLIQRNHINSFKLLLSSRHSVQILLENTEEPIADFMTIASTKNLYVTLDIGHAFIQGGDAMVRRYIRAFSNISHMHVHDNNGKRDEHMAIGQGKIDFPALAAELKRIRYSGTMALEVFTKNRALAKLSLSRIKRMMQ